MNVYIDKENLIAIYQNKGKEIIKDGIKLLKRHCDLYFYFSKKNVASDAQLGNILSQLTYGVGVNTKQTLFGENMEVFPDRPIKANIHRDIDKQCVLLVNENVRHVNEVGGVIAGTVGDEENIFNSLFLFNNEYGFDRRVKIGNGFNNWEDIIKFALPFTDIIIIDQYLFSEFNRANYNLYRFLEFIHYNKSLKTNIVVFIKNGEIDEGKSLSDFTKIIRDSIKRATDKKANITVIEVRDIKDVQSLAEHDRTVFTNYLRIYSGDSLSNYFNDDGSKKTKGREIEFSSLAKTENLNLARELIADMQKIIEWYEDNNPDAIQGDKKSNFLRFNN
jgi:hypothetical protein